ncbi:MAG: hypothetical protein NC393_02635 [Clostridium sp.]|nr:hypothetical protein [Clostridium sp.]MCM1171002.1 hypothetical protein [Clostridium sp.]MCM1208020.1 hypothetical protein [Ruminococcus sp.]
MKLKKKLSKKILALGMAFAVFFSSVTGSISVSFAENEEPAQDLNDSDFEQLKDETAYMVTIAGSENGRLYFYDSENDKILEETEKSFSAGDRVELIPKADEGFTYAETAMTNKDGIYEAMELTDGVEDIIAFTMPEHDTTVKGVFTDGTFVFEGVTSLEGLHVNCYAGNQPNPYADRLASVISSIYGLDSSSTNSVTKSSDYGHNEECAGTAQHVIDSAFYEYMGKKPFWDNRDAGVTINLVTSAGIRSLQTFADNNGLKMTVQDSGKKTVIIFGEEHEVDNCDKGSQTVPIEYTIYETVTETETVVEWYIKLLKNPEI